VKLYPHNKSNFDTVLKIGLIRIIELRIGNEFKNLVKEQDNYGGRERIEEIME
jgi:hypothetical protein